MNFSEKIRIQRFVAMLFGIGDEGYVEIRPLNSEYKPDWGKRTWIPVSDQARFAKTALELKDDYHVFFGVCTRSNQGKGVKEYVKDMVCLWADLDGKDYERGIDEALEVLQTYPLAPSAIVYTGNGYHGYWFLDQPYNLAQGHTKPEAMLKTLQVDELYSDPVADLTRILRVPYTLNIKEPDNPKPVKIKKLENIRYSFDHLAEELDWEVVIKRDYDTEGGGGGLEEGNHKGIKKVLQSDFIQYCEKKAKDLPEPLWWAMITNLIPFENGRKKIHQLSKPYPGYSKEETEQKIEHALQDAPGPHTVTYLKEYGFDSKDCQKAGVKSPAGLAFQDGREDG